MTRDTEYFQTFCKISKAFGTASTKQNLLDLIVNSAIETMAGKAACLFLRDEKQDVFVPVAQQGLSDTYLHANPMKAKRIVGALKKEGFLAFPDATEDPRLENHAAKRKEGIASLLTVPVTVKDRTIGVLGADCAHSQRVISEEAMASLKIVANDAALALERARLMDDVVKERDFIESIFANMLSGLLVVDADASGRGRRELHARKFRQRAQRRGPRQLLPPAPALGPHRLGQLPALADPA